MTLREPDKDELLETLAFWRKERDLAAKAYGHARAAGMERARKRLRKANEEYDKALVDLNRRDTQR